MEGRCTAPPPRSKDSHASVCLVDQGFVVLVGPNGTDARREHSVETASPERATHVALCLDDQVFRLLECLANQGFGTRRPQRDRCSPCGGRERPSSLWCALKGACCCSQGACCWMGSHVRFV